MNVRKAISFLVLFACLGGLTAVVSEPRIVTAASFSLLTKKTSAKVRISSKTTKNRKRLQDAMKKRRRAVQKQRSIANYFQYLALGSMSTVKQLESTERPLVLYNNTTESPKGGESGSIAPVKITKEEFLANAPWGPMYSMTNWWCSAAADYLLYTPDSVTRKNLGLYSGDCANPNAFITGDFSPQRLGTFDPAVPLIFTLRNVDPEDVTITEEKSDADGVCDVDYYRSLGHRDVYAAQFTCDDGFRIGVRNDIQFSVYVFPEHWPESANVEAVLKKQSSDEDGDGLMNRLELLLGTNPKVSDTDKDNLKDGDEYLAYQTSPLVKDTDGDGMDDGDEVERWRNPLGPGLATADQLERWSRLKNTPQPLISDLALSYQSGKAVVSWTTDVKADGIVNWGPTTKYGSHKSDFAFTRSHAIAFSVAPGSTYHYAVRACSVGPSPKCTTTSDLVFDAPASVVSPPVISATAVTVENGYATVSWQTDIDTDATVNAGKTTAYDILPHDAALQKTHALTFAVAAGTTYHYRVSSCTAEAVCTTSGDATFAVAGGKNPAPPVVTPTIATISNVAVSVENGYATVSWATDINTDGIVNWGTTTAYGQHLSDYRFIKSRSISFAVSAGITYHYAIRSCTPSGDCASTADATFTVPSAAPVAPTLSDVLVTVSGTTVTVSWSTDVDADGIINWGTTTAYGTHLSDFAFTKSHALRPWVSSGKTYHYAIRACTRNSLCTTTADATFTVP